MLRKQLHYGKWLAWLIFLSLATVASGQSTSVQTQDSAQVNVRSAQQRDANREELVLFNRFLDSHREIAEQVRKNPSLVNDRRFVNNHPALESYLRDHPGVRNTLRNDPSVFMRGEYRYTDNRDRDTDGRELAEFNRFLDTHREIAQQVRRDPSLADNQRFLEDHPALQTYLQDHPAVRQELQQHPDAFMQQEARYERDGGNAYDRDHDAHRRFGEFLGAHTGIAQQLSSDPSLVRRQDYLQDHPELQNYLNANPDVRQQLMSDPDTFVKLTEQWNVNGGAAMSVTSPTHTPKPDDKQ
jgi:hypothetical protein